MIDGKKSTGAIFGIQIGSSAPIIKTYGFANISTKREVKTNDQFRIASVTKPFTATAIIQLIESGKLSFNDTINKFFPNFPKGKEITIYQLLSHTSGIRNWYDIRMPENTPDNFPMCPEPHKYIEKMDKIFLFDPGMYHSYSNTGYVLLGKIIEKVSGVTYEDYLKEKIFNPSGMVDTEMETTKNASKQWAEGYGYNDSLSNPFIEPEKYPMPFSAGGLRSTAADLLKFITSLNSGKLISDELRAKMTTYAKLNSGKKAVMANFYFPSDFVMPEIPEGLTEFGYGLGFQLMEKYNTPVAFHVGSISGFQSYLVYIPKSNTTIAMLANTNGDNCGIDPKWEEIQKVMVEIE